MKKKVKSKTSEPGAGRDSSNCPEYVRRLTFRGSRRAKRGNKKTGNSSVESRKKCREETKRYTDTAKRRRKGMSDRRRKKQ